MVYNYKLLKKSVTILEFVPALTFILRKWLPLKGNGWWNSFAVARKICSYHHKRSVSYLHLQPTLRKNCLSKLIFQFVGIRSPKETSANSISNSRSTKWRLRDALEGIFKHKTAFILPRKPASFVCRQSRTSHVHVLTISKKWYPCQRKSYKTIQDFDWKLLQRRKR